MLRDFDEYSKSDLRYIFILKPGFVYGHGSLGVARLCHVPGELVVHLDGAGELLGQLHGGGHDDGAAHQVELAAADAEDGAAGLPHYDCSCEKKERRIAEGGLIC